MLFPYIKRLFYGCQLIICKKKKTKAIMKKTITKFTLILAATIFTLPTCLIAKDNSTKQNDIKSEKIITYVGAYGGLGNYNANIGISSAIFKKWLPDYQKFAFDVEIGHASESKTYDSVNGGSSLVSVKQTTKEDSSANYLLVNIKIWEIYVHR